MTNANTTPANVAVNAARTNSVSFLNATAKGLQMTEIFGNVVSFEVYKSTAGHGVFTTNTDGIHSSFHFAETCFE